MSISRPPPAPTHISHNLKNQSHISPPTCKAKTCRREGGRRTSKRPMMPGWLASIMSSTSWISASTWVSAQRQLGRCGRTNAEGVAGLPRMWGWAVLDRQTPLLEPPAPERDATNALSALSNLSCVSMVDGARWVEAHEHKLVLVTAGLGPVHLLDRHLTGPSGLGIPPAASCGVLSFARELYYSRPSDLLSGGDVRVFGEVHLDGIFQDDLFRRRRRAHFAVGSSAEMGACAGADGRSCSRTRLQASPAAAPLL